MSAECSVDRGIDLWIESAAWAHDHIRFNLSLWLRENPLTSAVWAVCLVPSWHCLGLISLVQRVINGSMRGLPACLAGSPHHTQLELIRRSQELLCRASWNEDRVNVKCRCGRHRAVNMQEYRHIKICCWVIKRTGARCWDCVCLLCGPGDLKSEK